MGSRPQALKEARTDKDFGAVPPLIGCPCFGSAYAGACICGPIEKFLRAHIHGQWHPPALTEQQRQWCVAEIRAVEGWSDYQMPVGDDVLAKDVLSAWRDYARDKGLYR